jgi:hypothetical protein
MHLMILKGRITPEAGMKAATLFRAGVFMVDRLLDVCCNRFGRIFMVFTDKCRM